MPDPLSIGAAAIMMFIWPGHDFPPQPYLSAAACERSLDQLRRAGHELFETVPGFRAWCVPDGPALMS
jgi:hypothetical protein